MSELKATTNAGTIDDPIPQELIWKDAQGKFYKVAGAGGSSSGADPRVGDLADLNTTDKTNVVAAINEVNLKQTTGGAPDANDINKGVTKLSDAIDSDLNATDGVTAATPLAVKNVNVKIGELANLNTTDKSNIVNALNEVKANSSGSGSGNSYVVTPTIIAPSNGALGQNTKVNIIGTAYKNVFPDDVRKHRVFEICTDNNFTSNVVRKEVDADSWTVEQVLSAETKHYARIKDISTDGYESAFSPVINFTTGAKVGAISPTITLLGYNDSPSDIGSGLKIKGSEYQSYGDAVDTHKATSWSIRSAVSRSNVWESLNDTVNKTQITVPRGTLQKGTSYIVSVIYHSTNHADSAPSEVKFTTSTDFGTVQAPVVSVSGYPDKVYDTSVFSGGVFSNTREPDTHVDTELVIIRSADMQQMVSVSTSNNSIAIQLDSGVLEESTQYKARMRYKGQNFGWSDWGELSFTTANEFVKYNYIGVPGTSTFGVGLAEEEDYKSVQLAPAEKCFDPTDFQYGLYTRGTFSVNNPSDHVAMKWIPKFYIKQLQKNEGTVNLTDEELTALLPYVEVTLEQMKEAQRRSPHNALVVAPADRFTDEADANNHGFYLMRGFIDGGKEHNGFFIANTITTVITNKAESKRFIRCGSAELNSYVNDEQIKSDLLRGIYSDVDNNITTTGEIFTQTYDMGVDNNCLTYLLYTPYQNCSIFAWVIISIISLIQSQYVTDINNCAWYDVKLQYNFPKGINYNGLRDANDQTVTINPVIAGNVGDVFTTKQSYNKTTHNGSITGITNVNGWLWITLLGINGNASKLLKKTASIYDLNTDNVDNYHLDLFEDFKGNITVSKYWGGNKSSFVDLSGDGRDLFGVVGVGDNQTNNANEFGLDYHTIYPGTNYYGMLSCGDWDSKSIAGVFARGSTDWFSGDDSRHSNKGARAMAYPR